MMLLRKKDETRLIVFKHSTDWLPLINGHGKCSGVGSANSSFHDADICQVPASTNMNEGYKQLVADLIAELPKMMETLSQITDLCNSSNDAMGQQILELIDNLKYQKMSPVATLLFYIREVKPVVITQKELEALWQSFTEQQVGKAMHELIEQGVLESDYLRSTFIVRGHGSKLPETIAELL